MTEVETQLETFVARFVPEIADRVRACRAALRRRLPTAIELVYDNYQALAIGYGASEKASDCVVSLAVYPGKVSLSFYYGADVPDPHGRLSGAGKQNRYVRLAGPETLAEPLVDELIGAALGIAARPLPPAGEGGYTVIKSVSPNQRPRRPGAPS